MQASGYERVASFGTAEEAEIVRGLLAASGLDARVAGTNHLTLEHFPTGAIAVLVPAADVAQAREIIASARAPDAADAPGAAPRAPRPVAPLWRSAVVVGLSLSAVGAIALLVPGARDSGQAFIIIGLLLAVFAGLTGSIQSGRRARRRE